MAGPIPYRRVTPPDWAQQLDGAPWKPVSDDDGRAVAWDKDAPCPRCGHGMGVHLGGMMTLDVLFTTDAECDCTVKHSDTQTGCGAFGPIALPSES